MDWSDIAYYGVQALGFLSSFLGNKKNDDSQERSYQYNLALQQQAQAWQERMSNTAHQREVADLIAAGINPIYTATGGSGASSGSVGASSVGSQQSHVASAQEAINAYSAISNAQSTTAQTQSNVAKQAAETERLVMGLQKDKTEIELMLSQAGLNNAQKNVAEKRLGEIDAQIKYLQQTGVAAMMSAQGNLMSAGAAQMNAQTNRGLMPSQIELNQATAQWAPAKIAPALGAGVLGLMGLGKFKPLKPLLTKVNNTKPVLKYLGY